MGEGVAEEARDPQRDVDAGPAELGQRDRCQARDPARLVVPHRPHAQQGEGLGGVVAAGAHGGRAPQHEADGAGRGARLGDVALDQGGRPAPADLPRQGRGQGLGVDRVEVATGGQDVGGAAGGRPARPGRARSGRRGRRGSCRPRRGWRRRAGTRRSHTHRSVGSTGRRGRRASSGPAISPSSRISPRIWSRGRPDPRGKSRPGRPDRRRRPFASSSVLASSVLARRRLVVDVSDRRREGPVPGGQGLDTRPALGLDLVDLVAPLGRRLEPQVTGDRGPQRRHGRPGAGG